MQVIDAHCDLLSKLLLNPKLDVADEASGLDVTLSKWKKSKVKLQWLAIWLPESLEHGTFQDVLRCIDLYDSHVAKHPEVGLVRTRDDLQYLEAEGRIGTLLALEGADALAGNLAHLRTLYKLGVRSLGLTWNYANWAADGVLEPRQGGFTRKGRALVKECERLGILIDVSHLCEPAFWELTELTDRPFLASHSNSFTICGHPRNLKDDQIEAIVQRNGMIGLNFYPPFIARGTPATIEDLLRHVERFCELGAERHLGLGSDYDGIDIKVPGLEHAGCFGNLIEALLKRYSEEQTEQFMHRNWQRFLARELPEA